MRAADLAEKVPMVRRETSAMEAARIIASLRLAGVVVADEHGDPTAVIPGPQVLRLVVPSYVRDNPTLAHVYDEKSADEICSALMGRTVSDLLDDDDVEEVRLPHVAPDDTLVEIATVMLHSGASVVVVRDRDGHSPGVVTVSRLMAAVLAAAGQTGPVLDATLERDLADVPLDEPRPTGPLGVDPAAG